MSFTETAWKHEFGDRAGAAQVDESERPEPRYVEQSTILLLADQLREAGALPVVVEERPTPAGWQDRWNMSRA